MVDVARMGGLTGTSRDDRARRAVKAFRSMQPTLTAFARALTRNKNVRVEMDAGSPRTDGFKIYMQPPIKLGDETKHDRSLCDRRDPVLLYQLCPACQAREDTLIRVYHEIAHIAFDSFFPASDEDKAKAITKAVAEHPGERADLIQSKLERQPKYVQDSYMVLAGLVSEFLPIIVNALEDARVNTEMFRARRGTKPMMEAFSRDIFVNGVQQADYSIIMWKDYQLNAQITVGLFCKASEYDYTGWFQPIVEEALGDEQLTALVDQSKAARSVTEVYGISFEVLERLRELGFCKLPEDPEPPPETEPEPEDSDEAESGESDDQQSEDQSGPGSRSSSSGEDDGDEFDESEPSQDNRGTGDISPEEDDLDGSHSGEAGSGGGNDSQESESSDSGTGDSSDESSDGDRDGDPSGEDADRSDDSESPERESSDGSADAERRDSEAGDGEGDSGSAGDAADALDTGADDGYGGTRLEGEDTSLPEYGTPQEVTEVLKVFGDHDEKPRTMQAQDDEEALSKAIVQGIYFETPSADVEDVAVYRYDDHAEKAFAWEHANFEQTYGFRPDRTAAGIDCDMDIPESVLGPALLQMRRVFTDNARAAHLRNQKSGRISQRVLGRRAWNDDDRLFTKKRLPGKTSYFVLIGIDVSGSTMGLNLALAKRAAMAQAELCARAGIDFAVYAHSAKRNISTFSGNFTIEFYRKRLDESNATDKILLYYSDGKMPAANADEELEILQREIQICKQKNYTLLGVGIRTDSPRRHGLDTVQIDSDDDLLAVVKHLEKYVLHR